MSTELHIELAARMPWLSAEPDSMWVASGKSPHGSFTDCLVRALPPMVTGSETPVFEVLIYAQLGYCVPASSVTTAKELLLVMADDPRTAYYVDDQPTLDAHLKAER
ncbi:hypothetical protein LRP67_16355 [Nocardioides sp. cx-169]|uniref:hypothetical protein n=1 Tax=Nocardioides sp. cx-169 TaxID=2899080 RepID=UPI001E46F3EF|nr:hypothetical protein [Nocardioides sp. cx-169]MCD4535666.1 hypothetical protein [Nocardioides sp. cx-169]